MQNYTSLLEVIKDREAIEYYLEDVTVEQFKKDVLELAALNTDKQIIKDTISQLEKLL